MQEQVDFVNKIEIVLWLLDVQLYRDLYLASYKWVDKDATASDLECKMMAITLTNPKDGQALYRTHFRQDEVDDTWWRITGRDELLPGQEFEGQVLLDSPGSDANEGWTTAESIQSHIEYARRSFMAPNARMPQQCIAAPFYHCIATIFSASLSNKSFHLDACVIQPLSICVLHAPHFSCPPIDLRPLSNNSLWPVSCSPFPVVSVPFGEQQGAALLTRAIFWLRLC